MNASLKKYTLKTPVDTDGDGKADLIAAYIRRPSYTADGEKVPAVLVANPLPYDLQRGLVCSARCEQRSKSLSAAGHKGRRYKFDFSAPLKACRL